MDELDHVFADYNASCPPQPSHYEGVVELLREADANPSSNHFFGRKAKRQIEVSREAIAKFLSVSSSQLYFTSGATEANNWIVFSVLGSSPQGKCLLSQMEHPSILSPLEYVEKKLSIPKSGFYPVDHFGRILEAELLEKIDEHTKLVCLTYVHNEIGTIQDVFTLAEKIKLVCPEAHIHCDGVQGLGKLDFSWLGKSQVDSMSFSAHKIGGLKGIGCLYLKRSLLQSPFIFGGGQEVGMRSGTENLAGIFSFGLRAHEIHQDPDWFKASQIPQKILREGLEKMPGISLHGNPETQIYNTVHFYKQGISADKLLLKFEQANIAVSRGSACTSGITKPSLALLAMGFEPFEASHSFRVSFGYNSQEQDAFRILQVLEP